MEKGACVPVRVHTVVISVQHSDDVTTSQLRKQLMDKVVSVVIPRQYIDSQTVFHLQPSGRFVIGGPQVSIGLLPIYTVFKKGATKLMAVTSSNLNRFLKFFHHWKEKENIHIYYFPPHCKYVAALPMGIQKFKFVIKLTNKIKTRIIFVKKIKFHSYG